MTKKKIAIKEVKTRAISPYQKVDCYLFPQGVCELQPLHGDHWRLVGLENLA